jgi:nanoRNase/pAp phosphatase (c-di-AMP/oligoRNAs hydrolase)
MRRNKNCSADMSKFVLGMSEKDAGGHEAAAGCKLNDNIIELTKTFKRIK